MFFMVFKPKNRESLKTRFIITFNTSANSKSLLKQVVPYKGNTNK